MTTTVLASIWPALSYILCIVKSLREALSVSLFYRCGNWVSVHGRRDLPLGIITPYSLRRSPTLCSVVRTLPQDEVPGEAFSKLQVHGQLTWSKKDALHNCVCVSVWEKRGKLGKTHFAVLKYPFSMLPEWFKSITMLCLHIWHSFGWLAYFTTFRFWLFSKRNT